MVSNLESCTLSSVLSHFHVTYPFQNREYFKPLLGQIFSKELVSVSEECVDNTLSICFS